MQAINFIAPPEIGHAIRVKVRSRNRWLRLASVEPYTRKSDGAQSFLLTWLDDHGVAYTSGLKSKSVTIKPHVEARP